MRPFLLVPFLLLIAAPVAAGTVYKCKDKDGRTVFSDVQCSPDAEVAIAADPKAGWVDGPYRGKEPPWHRSRERATSDQVAACIDLYRPILKDPDSASAQSQLIMENDRQRDIVITGRARNGFGGLGFVYYVCQLDSNGVPVEADTTRGEWVEKYSLESAYPSKPTPRW